jgi:hypothetical protein
VVSAAASRSRTDIPSAVALEPKRSQPIKVWAFFGAALLLVQIVVWARWIANDAETTPSGPSDPPHLMKVILNTWQIAGIFAMVFTFYWFLIRPWRRERKITTDGLLTLVFAGMYFQDPILNYFQNWCTYNSYLLNFGSWTEQIPGWVSANASNFAEPVAFVGPTYVYACLGATMFICWVMRKAKERRPNITTMGLVLVALGTGLITDFVLELAWMRAGLYTYPGAIKSLTLFHGHYYQFPIYEALMFGSTLAAWACLRYFKDDKGQTLAERGLEHLKVGARQKVAYRFFAIFAAMSALFFVTYNLPAMFWGMHAEEWPEDIQKRSYFTNYICGDGTPYACSSPGVPVPRENSVHLDPDGRTVVPADAPQLPQRVPFEDRK